jgi:hypothetical protein
MKRPDIGAIRAQAEAFAPTDATAIQTTMEIYGALAAQQVIPALLDYIAELEPIVRKAAALPLGWFDENAVEDMRDCARVLLGSTHADSAE